MRGETVFRRKIYDELRKWKECGGTRAVLIEGARRVGKSTIARLFAENEYESYILIDFSNARKETMEAFRLGISDMDLFFSRLQISEGIALHRRRSIIIFDEVQLYPKARQMIKHLVADGRYDYLETGSLISLKKNIENIVIPSEERRLVMHPMDFEEFLWAQNDEVTAPAIREYFGRRQPMGDAVHRVMMNRYREYMMVGGMPAVVSAYLREKNINDTDSEKRDILALYGEDMGKIPSRNGLKAGRIFRMIPSMLSGHSGCFSPGDIEKDSRTRDYLDAVQWLKESRTVNMCTASRDPDAALLMNLDENTFKCYMLDTGLFLSASFPEGSEELNDAYKAFLFGKLPVNEGSLFENMVAQELTASGHELIFALFRTKDSDKNYEVDFLLSKAKKIIPVEVRSKRSSVHSSLDRMIEKYGDRLGEKFVIHTRDLCVRDGITYIPIYMTMCL